jgi:tellurite resistance protein
MSDSFSRNAALEHLGPGWFVLVMGWSGLAMAWFRAEPLMGDDALLIGHAAATVAGLIFLILVLAMAWRLSRYRAAAQADLRHPVKHAFVAAFPFSMLLLGTLTVTATDPESDWGPVLWWLGALGELAATTWVLARWLRPKEQGGLQWIGITPLLFISVVGNVVVPLAGIPLGYEAWAAAQFAVGLLLWPVLLVLLITRVFMAGPLPPKMTGTWFIMAAPPSVIGLCFLQWDMAPVTAWGAWGIALFSILWALTQLATLCQQPFGIPHWGMSFPLAAFAALSLRLSQTPDGEWLSLPATAFLAVASVVIVGLTLATWRGLHQGRLLVPDA